MVRNVFVVPDGYKLVKVRTKEERIKELNDKINDLEESEVLDDATLLEWAKENHPDVHVREYIKELKKEKEVLLR